MKVLASVKMDQSGDFAQVEELGIVDSSQKLNEVKSDLFVAPKRTLKASPSIRASPSKLPAAIKKKPKRVGTELIGKVFRCFCGCYCTKSMDRKSPSKTEMNNEGPANDVPRMVQLIEDDLDKPRHRSKHQL